MFPPREGKYSKKKRELRGNSGEYNSKGVDLKKKTAKGANKKQGKRVC